MAKAWEVNEIPTILSQIYLQVLGREVDPPGLIFYGAQLSRGECSVRDVVRNILRSDEYKESFVKDKLAEEQLHFLYLHLFGREVDEIGLSVWSPQLREHGFDYVLERVITSDEYNQKFGDDTPPRMRGHLPTFPFPPSPWQRG